MKNKLFFTSIGVFTFGVAIVLFYLFLTGLNDGGNPLLFVGSLVCVGLGSFAFIRATKLAKPKVALAPAASAADGAQTLQKNNAMIQDFNKTAKAREELRMMEAAGNAQKEA